MHIGYAEGRTQKQAREGHGQAVHRRADHGCRGAVAKMTAGHTGSGLTSAKTRGRWETKLGSKKEKTVRQVKATGKTPAVGIDMHACGVKTGLTF
jgi:hypothetical protein